MQRAAATSCLFLAAAAAAPQTVQTQTERLLPQWLTGIIAVSAFLFLVFVFLLVKKAWCEKPNRGENSQCEKDDESVRSKGNSYTDLDVRNKQELNAYDNLVIDSTEGKVTAM